MTSLSGDPIAEVMLQGLWGWLRNYSIDYRNPLDIMDTTVTDGVYVPISVRSVPKVSEYG